MLYFPAIYIYIQLYIHAICIISCEMILYMTLFNTNNNSQMNITSFPGEIKKQRLQDIKIELKIGKYRASI